MLKIALGSCRRVTQQVQAAAADDCDDSEVIEDEPKPYIVEEAERQRPAKEKTIQDNESERCGLIKKPRRIVLEGRERGGDGREKII